MRHKVVFVVYDGILGLDLAGPMSVVTTANKDELFGGRPPYGVMVASARGGAIRTADGADVLSTSVVDVEGPIGTLVVVGGPGALSAREDPALMQAIKDLAARSERVCSVCTGALILAAAGLIAGRKVATHWAFCDWLAVRHPDVTVDADAIFVRDGPIWTSAGVTAGIDLMLAVVEEDHGRSLAMSIARELVVFFRRPGGQSQFSVMLSTQAASESGAFESLHSWIAEHLAEDLRVDRLAAQAHMSPRNFARVYKAKVGRTPAKTVELMRLEAARRALETTEDRIESIARRIGFSDEEHMRVTFIRHLGVAPRDYRRRFSATGSAYGSAAVN